MSDSKLRVIATVSGDDFHVRHGEHTDTIESVDIVFREQRKLSFTYGAVFFGVTLGIPALTVMSEAWYGKPILGGLTANYTAVSILYFVFLWAMAWRYSKQADRLDEKLMKMADDIASGDAGGGQQ